MTTRHDFSRDFHTEPDIAYLNCAYHGAIPHVAVAAMNEAAHLKQAPYRLPDVAHFTFPEDYRAAVARFIAADPRQVVLGDSATHGIMILVRGLRWQKGDEVVVSDGEFPANRFPWQALEAEGVTLRQVPVRGAAWLDNIERALTARTRVLSLSWVNYAHGFRIDLAAVSRLCRERGVLFAVDASQGIGGLPFRVGDASIDLVTCATYKWLLGPYGLGFAWIGAELLQELSTSNINWMRVRGAEDFNRLAECDLDLVDDASRFDVNETANFFNLAAGTASLRYLQDIGIDTIAAHDAALVQQLVDALPPELEVRSDLSPPHRSHILGLRGRDARHTQELFENLRQAGVFVSQREGNLRVSPHLYNTPRDIERLLGVLEARSSRAV